uniref:Uncharacterized protein n=1 Tax=Sander lucioperca TaxID=283035 RepID=A0A8C9X6Z2_SANLU
MEYINCSANRLLFHLYRHTTSQKRYYNTGRKKSKVRLNDQEKMIKIATPKEHPYSSHISKFAMFPSFSSPDDPKTGVRAASQPFLNPLIPNSAPDITLLSKTIGSPYRHEVLETTINTRKKAVMWTGEHGFCDPLKGENQVFYPTPPKTVLPNPKLRDWDLSISERTSNMLKNLERTQWLTSYQMHHTGSGPTNPLKIDDFKDKICDITGMNSHTAPLVESLRTFATERPLDLYNCPPSQEEMEVNKKKSLIELYVNDEPSSKMQYYKAGRNVSSISQSSVAKDLAGIESNVELSLRASSEQEKLAKGREPPHSISNPCILPRMDRVGNVGREGAALRLLDLQNSFSKTKAHRNFNSSITRAAVNLRDNVVTGKKHDFYGINCYYLHG